MPEKRASSPQFLLTGMADAVGELLQMLRVQPQVIAGHSSGAALAVTLCLRGATKPSALLSFNGAFFPLGGWPGRLLLPAAKVLAQTPLIPRIFSAQASHAAVLRHLIDGTGSRLDSTGIALYHQLVSNPSHAAGALAMMANWDLNGLSGAMALLQMPLHLVVGSNDRTIAPEQARRLLRLLAGTIDVTLTRLDGLGHLAHEETPLRAARFIERAYFDAVKRPASS
jgi:magnesium chelatase accessory protein